jgi:polar amino acid transport system permease protein
MLGEARQFSNETFTTEAITVVGVAFIVIAYPASLLIRALERRLVNN